MEPLLEHRRRWDSCDLSHRDSNLANKDQIWSAPPAQHSEGSSGLSAPKELLLSIASL